MVKVFAEEQMELLCHGLGGKILHPGVGGTGGVEGGFPTYQRGKSTQFVHQALGKKILTGAT